MPQTPPPPDGAAIPDSDAALRHNPSPNPPGDVATDTTKPAEAPGSGPTWVDPGASPVLQGEKQAGGADPSYPHLFHLADAAANVFPGGGLQGAHGENWPMLQDQNAAIYIARLAPGGIREPHWHPSSWEVNFVMQGQAHWTFVGPKATQDEFDAVKGDVVFVPQGHFHYFANASDTEDLVVLIVFNSSSGEPGDDIGIVHALSALQPEVLGAVFGADPQVFRDLPKKLGRVVISSTKDK